MTGKRDYKNIRKLFGKALHKGNIENKIFITTDGFTPYDWVLKRMLGPACLYRQVVKKRKKNRIAKVDRKIIIGSKAQVTDALECSEDWEKPIGGIDFSEEYGTTVLNEIIEMLMFIDDPITGRE